MKILHVIASADPRGGGPIEGVKSMSEIWTACGHDCHIVCLDDPSSAWLASSGLTTFPVGSGRRWRVPVLGYSVSPLLVSWLRRHAKDYAAILVHGLWNYASLGTWRALAGSGTAYFVFTHGMLDPWFIKAYPRKAQLKALFWKLFEHRVLRDAAGVLFTTEDERDLAAQSFKPYVAKPVVVGFGTADIDGDRSAQRQAFRAAVPSLGDRRFILFLGRIHPKKGVDLLISAFAKVAAVDPAVDLVIAGPDQVGWQRELMGAAERLGITRRIHWPGMLTGAAKWGAFASADSFALPSHQENFGVAVAEALIFGLPVLITDKVNIWKDIAADGAGVVVDDTEQGVESGLQRMFAMPEADRRTMSSQARQCFLNRYDIESVAARLLDVLVPAQAGR